MKNIYEILKTIGLEVPDDKREEFDKAMSENYKTVAEADKLRTARDSYKMQLETATQKLEGFKDVDVEDLKGQIATLTTTLANEKANYEQQLADRDFNDMLNAAISASKAKNVKAVRALLDLDAIRESRNQTADLEAALKKVSEENDYLFESDEPIDNGTFVGATSPNPKVRTLDDLDKMSFDEYRKYRQEN